MSNDTVFAPGPDLAARIEAHCIHAWPAETVQYTDDGWVLRATPGILGRGRSNHALTPTRPIEPTEYESALNRAAEFAIAHGIGCGLQIGPTTYHEPLLADLAARGWSVQPEVIVMAADTQAVAAQADPDFELEIVDAVTPEWMAAWSHCDPRDDTDEHLDSIFPRMAGIARFVRANSRAVGISVERDDIVGLFCLAVSPGHRRQRLGTALVRAMLARHDAPLTYLQVFSTNTAGRALYESLGFKEAYRYRHALAPPPDAVTGVSKSAAYY